MKHGGYKRVKAQENGKETKTEVLYDPNAKNFGRPRDAPSKVGSDTGSNMYTDVHGWRTGVASIGKGNSGGMIRGFDTNGFKEWRKGDSKCRWVEIKE